MPMLCFVWVAAISNRIQCRLEIALAEQGKVKGCRVKVLR
jgi:hypothetical protein